MADTATETKPAETKPAEETNDKPAEEAVAPPTPKEMRAVVLTGFGGLKSVKVMKKPEPTPAEGEILIRVKASGLNFLDLMVRQGVVDGTPKTPFILGFECAGEVEAVGENVTTYQPGDKVVALPEYKAWAELVAVPVKYVYKMPMGMSFQDAAAITMNFTVAHFLLFEIGGLSKGKSVFVHSAGGGVGQAISQLCKTVEDVTVFGVASQGKHETIKDKFDHILDRTLDYVQEVRKESPEGVDIFLDCLCGDDSNKGYGLTKPMGKYILYGSSSIVTGETKSFFTFAKSWWQVDKISPLKLYDENRTIAGFNLRHLLYQQNGERQVREVVERVFKLWQEKKIVPVIDSTYALEDIPDAMQKMHDRKNVGKITLDPAMEPKPKPVIEEKKKGKEKEKKEEKENKENKEAAKEPKKSEETNGEKVNGEGAEEEKKNGEESPPPASGSK